MDCESESADKGRQLSSMAWRNCTMPDPLLPERISMRISGMSLVAALKSRQLISAINNGLAMLTWANTPNS
jgi:hypothetical protein